MKRYFFFLIVFIVLIISLLSCGREPVEGQGGLGERLSNQDVTEKAGTAGSLLSEIAAGDFLMEEKTISPGENLVKILRSQGVSAGEGVFDLRKLRVGNAYTLYFTPDSAELALLVYRADLRRHIAFYLKDSIKVVCHEIPLDCVVARTQLVLQNNIWSDLQAAGQNPLLAISLSEVYAWTIDFFGLQRGDSISICYDSYRIAGKEVEIGPIRAAYFRHVGKEYRAYRFMQDSQWGYWNASGENLQKAFLKAPLRYSRISSRFSYARRHPVTRRVQPHTGVDYAAPTGTPVQSIGDGTVVQKAYVGAGGNQVKIRHNGVYTTGYLHLSRFARGLAVGDRVVQGQVIGYVGSTGRSTGPHLDFRVWQNGKPVNPLTLQSPPADPIHEKNSAAFRTTVKGGDWVLNGLIGPAE